MATRSWTDGGTDGNWNSTANWSGATVPIAGDTVIIDTSSRSIQTNLDQSAVTLARLEIGSGFTGKIGTSANFLRVGVSGSLVVNGAAATPDALFISGATDPIANIHVHRVGTDTADGTLTLKGTITTCAVYRGHLVLESGTITTLWIEGEGGNSDAVHIKNVGATCTTTHLFAGKLLAEDGATAVFTTLNDYSSGANIEIADGTLTTLNVYGNTPAIDWSAGGATITTANIYSGRLWARGASQTITNWTVHDRGVMDASDGSVTFTNAGTKFGNGYALGSPGKTIQFA